MITNPNTAATVAAIRAELAEDAGPAKPMVRVSRGYRFRDPDKQFDKMIRVVETKVTNLDAKILERRGHKYETVHYRSLREMMASPAVRKRIKDAFKESQLKEASERITELVESNEFGLGLYSDETNRNSKVFNVTDTILPSLNSPYSKQMLFADYLDMHRKCFEAATRNPIGKRIVDIIPQFVLGRGVIGHTDSEQHQEAWDEFWQRNRMKLRIKQQLLRELLIYGEIFLRYFNTREGLTVRSLDPSSIWDIVTDPDDIETVNYYHQQYVILNNSPVAGISGLIPSTLIIRHIPGDDIDHFKINAVSSEKRGRSQLYCILGWLLRFKEFSNDRVILNKMRSMFALDVSVEGGTEELTATEEQFAQPPGPGAVLVHNKAVDVEFKNANNNANEAKTDGELLLKIIAVGAGVSEQFLGVSAAGTRAGALIQTEPDVKNFEAYQELIEEVLYRGSERVWKAKKLKSPKPEMEFTFPAIASEDRSAKLKDIAFSEAMDYITKERAASMAAREFQITNYDYHEERKLIDAERADGTQVIATGLQQVAKIAPPEAGGEAPGLGADMVPGLGSDTAPLAHTSGQMGFSAKNLSGRGMSNTKATLNRSGFTRGGEKTAITNKRSSGTPLRHSLPPEEGAQKRSGWTEKARAASLAARRRKRELREAAQRAENAHPSHKWEGDQCDACALLKHESGAEERCVLRDDEAA